MPGTAQAQGSDIDLAVSITVLASASVNDDKSGPTVTLTNRGSDTAYTVEVVIEADSNVSLDPTSNANHNEVNIPPIGSVAIHDSKLIWSIDRLPGKSAYQYTAISADWASGIQIVQYVATVSSRSALEPEHNNRAEVWQARKTGSFRALTPRYAVTVAVDNRFPQAQGDVIFTVTASNTAPQDSAYLREAQVTVPLPAGLTYKSATAPTGTTYNSSTGIWTIGDWDPSSSTSTHSLTLTATRAANVVLNEQCVTAEISAEPPEPPLRVVDNRMTFCLGAPDEPVLFQSGEVVELWTLYPCVAKTTHPCTTADTVEVFPVTTIEKWGSEQIIKSSPGKVNVFIHVDPVEGRVVDTHTQSVSTVSWQTNRTDSHGDPTPPGVQIGFVRKHLKVANWHQIIRTVSVSGVIAPTASDQTCDAGDSSPPCAPGRMKIRLNTSGNTFFDPNPSHERSPFSPSSDSNTFSKYFAEFATLGTYVVDFKAQVTNKDTTTYPNPFSGTTRSIFHVGPVAELAVRDAGPSPDATPSQRAFTIIALNNGPSAAPAAQVTVDLQGAIVSQAIASQGSYDDGVWTLGALSINDPPVAPTLTLITTAPADTSITATITNTDDYQVCIDSSGDDLSHTTQATCVADTTNGGSWHTATYYDYISDNNTATVTAQAGAGDSSATARVTVRWDAVAGADHYQLWRQGSPWELIHANIPSSWISVQDSTAEPGRAYLYTVRAMDAQGLPISSQTVVAAAPRAGGTRIVTRTEYVHPYGPNRLRATAAGPGRINLRWTAPRTLYQRSVTSFEVEVSQDQDTWTTLEPYLEEARYTHTGLQPATTYYYRVYAHNSRGRSLASDVVGATTDPPLELTGALGIPPPQSFQSGVGVLSGWACEAEEVVIQINGAPVPVPYGLARPDTQAVCGDTDNGFSRPINWNQLGAGRHELIALVDGTELGRATVTVTTLGTEFREDAQGTCEVEDFPTPGERVTLMWQEAQQNFVITDGSTPPAGRAAVESVRTGFLENPAPNSFQSGVGVLSGWVCEAEAVTVEIAGQAYSVPYGLDRADTRGACGDTANGFGMVFNWNAVGPGEHDVVAWADGVVFDRATVRVTTLGEEFLTGVAGTCAVPDFPTPGDTVTLTWQEAQQNFVMTAVE